MELFGYTNLLTIFLKKPEFPKEEFLDAPKVALFFRVGVAIGPVGDEQGLNVEAELAEPTTVVFRFTERELL